MEKIVDGIKMSEVKAPELAEMVKKFNSAKLGAQVKAGANPLGTVKAFVKAVESLDEDKQAMLPDAVSDYYNRIVVSDEELDAEADKFNEEEERKAEQQKRAEEAAPPTQKASTKKSAAKADKKPASEKKPASQPKVQEEKKPVAAKANIARGSISDDMIIEVVEGKEPKNKDSKAYKLVQLYKKHKTVGAFLKKSEWPGARAALNFDKYHGRIVLKQP